jgi:hypothetical protein
MAVLEHAGMPIVIDSHPHVVSRRGIDLDRASA